jgi:hypothetical protein
VIGTKRLRATMLKPHIFYRHGQWWAIYRGVIIGASEDPRRLVQLTKWPARLRHPVSR